MNIAQRVALLMNTSVGNLVGYHIGKKAVNSYDTKILFVTTGILL